MKEVADFPQCVDPGTKATTRKRGLDHETNKELLFKHIRENDVDGSPLGDLRQVLPALSGKQVQNLLRQLRDEGRVHVIGVRRWARWYISPKLDKES